MDEDFYKKYNDYINEKKFDFQYNPKHMEDYMTRGRRTPTAEDRLQYKREREALVGALITQEGAFCGALVKEHVRGSQYVVRMADGSEVFASHKKRLEGQRGLSGGGWKLWEDRS